MPMINQNYGSLVSEDKIRDTIIQDVSDQVAAVVVQCLNAQEPHLSEIIKIQSQLPQDNDMQQRIWHNVLYDPKYKELLSRRFFDSIGDALGNEGHFNVLDTVLDCNVALEDKIQLTRNVFEIYHACYGKNSHFMSSLKKLCPILPKQEFKNSFLKVFGGVYLCKQEEWNMVQPVFDIFFNETKKKDKQNWLNLSDKESSLKVGDAILNCFERTYRISKISIEQTLFLPLLQMGLQLNFNPDHKNDKKQTFLHRMEEKIEDYSDFFDINPTDATIQQARELLLKSGADFRAENEYGSRAYCKTVKHLDALAIYVKYGAELEYTDQYDRIRSITRPNTNAIKGLNENLQNQERKKEEFLKKLQAETTKIQKDIERLQEEDSQTAIRITTWVKGIQKVIQNERSSRVNEES